MTRLVALALAGLLGTAAAAAEPSPLDLSALLAEAESGSPAIRAAVARGQAANRAVGRAETLPDPTLGFSLTNASLDTWTLGTSEMANATVSWNQDVPWPGKRRLAGDVARAEERVAEAEVDRVRARVRAAVKTLYVELLRFQRTDDVLRQGSDLLAVAKDASRSRFETGEGAMAEVLKAGAAISRLEAERVALDGERNASLSELAAVLGRTSAGGLGPAVAEPAATLPDSQALETAALDKDPEVRARRAAAGRDATRVEAAKRDLKPDLSWGAAFGWRNGLDPLVSGSFGVRLPVFRDRKQQQEIALTEFENEAARLDVAAREAEVLGRVRGYAGHLEHLVNHMRLLEEAVLAQDRAALDASVAAYAAGRTPFVGLLDDIRSLLEDQRSLEEQKAERLKALIALESLTGLDLVGTP